MRKEKSTRPQSAVGIRSRQTGRLLGFLVLTTGFASLSPAFAQSPALTTVTDTIYKSDGSLASGSVVISWPPFVSADNKPVFGGTKTIALSGGSLSVSLIPTVGATPSGTSYDVKYYQSGGVWSEETWVVPGSASPLTLSQVRVAAVPSTNVIISPSQVNGTAIVGAPLSTQTITAPASTGAVPLALKGNTTANADVAEFYDSQAAPELQSRFDSAGALNTAKPITSIVPTGSAPLVVTSTTKVANLNADLLDGIDSTGFAQTTRALVATAPLSGGGDLSADRSISCPTCTTNAAALAMNQLVVGAGGQAAVALGSLGSATTVLHGNASGAPGFSAVNLANDVTGVLPAANGGAGRGVVAMTFSATPTFDASAGNVFTMTLTGNITSSTISNASAGEQISLLLCQDATGSRTMTWPATLKLSGAAFALSTTAGQCDALTAAYDGTNWYEIARSTHE